MGGLPGRKAGVTNTGVVAQWCAQDSVVAAHLNLVARQLEILGGRILRGHWGGLEGRIDASVASEGYDDVQCVVVAFRRRRRAVLKSSLALAEAPATEDLSAGCLLYSQDAWVTAV